MNYINRVLLTVCIASLMGCTAPIAFFSQFDCENEYKLTELEGINPINIKINKFDKTNSGIRVDKSGLDVDLNKIDELTDQLESCLGIKIKRCGFRVKIHPKSTYYESISRELFECKLPSFPKDCEKEDPPCGCSGISLYPNTLVTTKSLGSYKHELIHIVTGIMEHSHAVFKRCQK